MGSSEERSSRSPNDAALRRSQNPHRNNAAEWVMWAAIYPVIAMLRLFSRKAAT